MVIEFLKPGVGVGGTALEIYLPAKGRNILPAGELVEVDAYVERRLAKGSLVRAEVAPANTETKKDSQK